jgi:hypothetical protein
MNFDLRYFDYCAKHIADVHNNLLNRSIGSVVPLQVLTGVTPDISTFHIPFWKHCLYWNPHIKWQFHQCVMVVVLDVQRMSATHPHIGSFQIMMERVINLDLWPIAWCVLS